jgi:preprotein translocase subunit YajC
MFFATPAYAQAASAAPAEGPLGFVGTLLPFLLIFVLMYFLMIRPQQKRAKEHQAMIGAIKRNDTVVLSNGMIGKVTRVEDKEAMVEIATGVNVRVLKGMIAEVRAKGDPAPANDSKS